RSLHGEFGPQNTHGDCEGSPGPPQTICDLRGSWLSLPPVGEFVGDEVGGGLARDAAACRERVVDGEAGPGQPAAVRAAPQRVAWRWGVVGDLHADAVDPHVINSTDCGGLWRSVAGHGGVGTVATVAGGPSVWATVTATVPATVATHDA